MRISQRMCACHSSAYHRPVPQLSPLLYSLLPLCCPTLICRLTHCVASSECAARCCKSALSYCSNLSKCAARCCKSALSYCSNLSKCSARCCKSALSYCSTLSKCSALRSCAAILPFHTLLHSQISLHACCSTQITHAAQISLLYSGVVPCARVLF